MSGARRVTLQSIHAVLSVLCLIGVMAPRAQAETPETDWNRGMDAVDRKAWGEAAAHFLRYREAKPGDPDGWVMEGWVRRQHGESDEADRLFQGALQIDPGQPDALHHFAAKAWRGRDLVTTMGFLERMERVPGHLEGTYHHMFGAVLVMLDRTPTGAVAHLSRVENPDEATRVLLAVARFRAGDSEGGSEVARTVCRPSSPDRGDAEAWVRCLDVDYCGELIDQRLEILRRLASLTPTSLELVADSIRVHLRHKKDPGPLLDRLAEAAGREPALCRLPMLEGLGRRAAPGSEPNAGCGLLMSSLTCARNGGNTSRPSLSGPLFDPRSGALLPGDAIVEVLSRLVSRQCKEDSLPAR